MRRLIARNHKERADIVKISIVKVKYIYKYKQANLNSKPLKLFN
jgi:hypothetical protein